MAGQCPPNLVRRMFSRTTTQALREHRAHEHRGAHPYRVILGEVRGRAAACFFFLSACSWLAAAYLTDSVCVGLLQLMTTIY
jgi:hypothetical protein